MSQLFTPLKLRELTIRNRVFVSPMCMYSSIDGFPNAWHMVHLGSRAVGGAGLVMQEATAVTPDARITHGDAGIWSDEHIEAYRPIAQFIADQGAVPAIQLAHAGRKASTQIPWEGGKALGPDEEPWQTVGPSAIAFAPEYSTPRELTLEEIDDTVERFGQAARRALAAGFQVIEVHAAHGYLIHEFLSPLSNQRTDEYGGSFENRTRLLVRIARNLRSIWPNEWPLFVRLSCTDWVAGGWDLPQSISLSRVLKDVGIDLIDCSSGGNVATAKIPVGPGYQVSFAEEIRRDAHIATAAVGMITEPQQAEEIVASGQADAVLLARELLRDPYWPLHAAAHLGHDVKWPVQYERAKRSPGSLGNPSRK